MSDQSIRIKYQEGQGPDTYQDIYEGYVQE